MHNIEVKNESTCKILTVRATRNITTGLVSQFTSPKCVRFWEVEVLFTEAEIGTILEHPAKNSCVNGLGNDKQLQVGCQPLMLKAKLTVSVFVWNRFRDSGFPTEGTVLIVVRPME